MLLILERRREKEREINIDVREKHQLVASSMYPDWGSNPQAYVCFLTWE